MFKVISNQLENCYDMRNTIINEINFCNVKKMNCVFTSNHYGIKCVSHLLQLEPCNDMWYTIIKAINFSKIEWSGPLCWSWAIQRKKMS